MDDEKLHWILKALNDAARVAIGIKLITRLAMIFRKWIKRSKPDDDDR